MRPKSIVLAVALLFVLVTVSIFESNDAYSESVTVNGVMFTTHDDLTASADHITDVHATDITIPATIDADGRTYDVTELGMYLTDACESLRSISIPDTVRYVGTGSLSCVTIEMIDVDADNPYLSSIDNVLYDASGQELIRYAPARTGTSFDVPETVTDIRENAFRDASSLVSVRLPDKMTILRSGTFMGCISLEDVGSYGSGDGCLPESLTYIDSMAFEGCTSMTGIVLNGSLKHIGLMAFSKCSSLTAMHIPSNVTGIEFMAFTGCTSLMEFTVSEFNTHYESKDGVLFETDLFDTRKVLTAYPAAKEGDSYTISAELTSVTPMAFYGAVNLKTVMFEEDVVSIDTMAFAECGSLEKVVIPDTVLLINSLAFYKCESLHTIEGARSVITIGQGAFQYTAVTEYSIPDSVRYVMSEAFFGCESLREVHIPSGVRSIGKDAFLGDISLEKIVFEGKDTVLEENSLSVGVGSVKTIKVVAPSGFSIPDDSHDMFTEIDLEIIGERPYPYENLIGVAICILILIGIIRLFREV